ncbi:hypothetical protein K474DRAFT_941645 [Panus rudis PR-1116 ss-1]|nr:hypothetical protein K474DRAFT_941645 [Panus rudis PR-1116 ss-1]
MQHHQCTRCISSCLYFTSAIPLAHTHHCISHVIPCFPSSMLSVSDLLLFLPCLPLIFQISHHLLLFPFPFLARDFPLFIPRRRPQRLIRTSFPPRSPATMLYASRFPSRILTSFTRFSFFNPLVSFPYALPYLFILLVTTVHRWFAIPRSLG